MNQKHKVNVNHLKFVPKTLLITLKAKYLASCDPSISYKDPYIEQIYENISEINNKFANVDAIADQYIKLI